MDDGAALDLLAGERWDLAAMVRARPVPVAALVATAGGSALTEPGRAAVLGRLGRAALVVESGHGVHPLARPPRRFAARRNRFVGPATIRASGRQPCCGRSAPCRRPPCAGSKDP